MMFFISTTLPERTHASHTPPVAQDDDDFVFEYHPEVMDEEAERTHHSFD